MYANGNETKSALVFLATHGLATAKAGSLDKEIRLRCASCAHAREVPGNCHILCAKPDAQVTGNPLGIERGWFMYPMLFDPTWMTTACRNYEPMQSDHPSASQSATQEQ